MGVLEILYSFTLVIPAIYKPLAIFTAIAAVFIAVEMLIFCGLHLASAEGTLSPMIYWLVVAAICATIAYGRFVLKPL